MSCHITESGGHIFERGVCLSCGMVDPSFDVGACSDSVLGAHHPYPDGVCLWCSQVVKLPVSVELVSTWL